MSSYEVRVPEALILAPIPPWIKMIWIAVRSFQGAGGYCFASLPMIGERAPLTTGEAMDKGQVSNGLKELIRLGFIERIGNRKLRCLSPEPPENDAPKVEQDSTFEGVDNSEKVEQDSTNVEHHSTKVEQGSTPSENQQGKPTRKTKRVSNTFSDTDWQMVFAATAYDRLTDLQLIPESMARKRAATLQAFADEFDKLRRLDEFDQETIREVMRWLLSPTNWWIQTANFRSVLKLRKPHKDGGTYFEHFLSQVRTNARPKQSNHTSYSADDAASIYAAALAGASSAGA